MTRQAWDRDYARRGRLWGGVRLDPHTTRVLDGHPRLARGRWMDAGCGDGKGLVPLVARLHPRAPPVVALDSSSWALVHARQALLETHGPQAVRRVAFVLGDVRRPGHPGVFDAVRAVHVLGHLRNDARRDAMQALLGLLRPEGLLLASEFGTGDFRHGKGTPVETGTYRRGTGIETHYFHQDELRRLVEQAGGIVHQLAAESYRVQYAGQDFPRQRLDLVAARAALDDQS